MNRTVTGLTAYNLEYKKNGGNGRDALAYSTAHNTMGDYSSWNAAPIFNNRTAGRCCSSEVPENLPAETTSWWGDEGRPAGDKQFAGLMVTHGMIAGVLGLPTGRSRLPAAASSRSDRLPPEHDCSAQDDGGLLGKKGGEIAQGPLSWTGR